MEVNDFAWARTIKEMIEVNAHKPLLFQSLSLCSADNSEEFFFRLNCLAIVVVVGCGGFKLKMNIRKSHTRKQIREMFTSTKVAARVFISVIRHQF